MAAVAVLALDCFCLKTTYGGQGILLIGIASNIGVFRCWCGLVTNRPFWLGFEMCGSAAVLAYLTCYDCIDGWPCDAMDSWLSYWVRLILSHAPVPIAYRVEYLINSGFSSHSSD